MQKAALYSNTQRSRLRRKGVDAVDAGARAPASAPVLDRPAATRAGAFLRRNQAGLLVLAGMLFTLLTLAVFQWTREAPQEITQDEIDEAVVHAIENKSLPSRAARAAEAVRQSVVSVRGYSDEPAAPAGQGKNRGTGKPDRDNKATGKKGIENKAAEKPDEEKKGGERPSGIGSGVVIVDSGIILTNLHVVNGMKRVVITFYDGSESEADLVSVHPENDLAVLRARTIPDDLPAATLGSSASLKPGDEVVAVGFPFGIGPSISAGVISGLNREFRSPQGQRVLTQLIQFDAAANPGNSGGPLVNMDGDVVGIVTAIYTTNEARTFIGIGFAATIAVAGSMVGISPF